MKKLAKVFFTLSFILFITPASADSPITSTRFSLAYEDESIVQVARKSAGLLTDELMQYLVDEKKPIAVKMALINELSWSPEGKNNTKKFVDFLKKTKKYNDVQTIKQQSSADILLSLAYIQALENRHDAKEAVAYAELAKNKNKQSYTVQIISGVIKAQLMFDISWCESFHATDNVRKNSANLNMDMRANASEMIFEYMDLYESYCK